MRAKSSVPLKISFARSQVAAATASGLDFATLIFLVEFFGVWYVAATAIGASVGAITNFLLGRYWSFRVVEGVVAFQAMRYALVSFASLVLNSSGVFFLTEYFRSPYVISRLVAAILIGFFFNFPMHRIFVFK